MFFIHMMFFKNSTADRPFTGIAIPVTAVTAVLEYVLEYVLSTRVRGVMA